MPDWVLDYVVLHELHACEEEQEDEAQVGQEVDVVVDLREVEAFRADQDPEQDLEDINRRLGG